MPKLAPPSYLKRSTVQNNGTLAATWMDLEMIILSEVSQKEKDKYHMRSLLASLAFSSPPYAALPTRTQSARIKTPEKHAVT